jgi:dipeptidyl-peptidase-4
MLRKLLFFVALISEFVVLAQTELSIYNTQISRYREFYPETLSEIQWRPNSPEYSYNTFEKLVIANAKSDIENSLDLTSIINEYNDENDTEIPYLSHIWINETDLFLYHSNTYLRYSVNDSKLKYTFKLPEDADEIFASPNGNYLAFVLNNNLFLTDSTGFQMQLTNDGGEGIVYGEAVHRVEFGIDKGIFWSGDSKKIAFYRKDETMVEKYPLVDITTPIAEANPIYYPMTGRKSHHVTIGIVELDDVSAITYLNTGAPLDRYFSNLTWDKQNENIYIQELNRGQDHMKLKKYNINSLNSSVIYEEKHEKYVEPQHLLYFVESLPGEYLYHARPDGFSHLYIMNDKEGMVRPLTSGDWEVKEFLGADKEFVYHLSTFEEPTSISICKTNIKTGYTSKLNTIKGVNNASLNYKHKLLINTVNNRSIANKIQLLNTDGELLEELLTAEDSYKRFNLGEERNGKIKAADNSTDLYYRMILPPNFDSTKTYPVVIYTYAGPHVQLIKNSYYTRTELWLHYMAQEGYVGFILDSRGSYNRGLEFENVTYRKLGQEEMKDQLKGVDFLKLHSFVDSTRIGVHGWSYGGYMTISLMVNYPEVFKVGACGGPVTDWKYYEIMYGERYMDTPEENPEGYELTSVNNKAANLEGKLLIVHGAQDPTVVWQHSMVFIRECIKANKQVDYFVYPTHEHGVRGMDYVHLMTKISQYFFDYL